VRADLCHAPPSQRRPSHPENIFSLPVSFGGVHEAIDEVVNVDWANNLTTSAWGRNKWNFPHHFKKPADIVFLIATVDHCGVQHNATMIAAKK
jgi:hypothetical protein